MIRADFDCSILSYFPRYCTIYTNHSSEGCFKDFVTNKESFSLLTVSNLN